MIYFVALSYIKSSIIIKMSKPARMCCYINLLTFIVDSPFLYCMPDISENMTSCNNL